MKPVQDRLWTAEETAAYLQIPKATLYQWRYLGIGPKAGRVGRLFAMTQRTLKPGSADSKVRHERF